MRPPEKVTLPAGASMLSTEGSGQLSLPFRLTGSQAKTAFALRQNCERMIAGNAPKHLIEVEYPCGTGTKKMKVWVAKNAENINYVGFLTLTVGDYECGPVRHEDERRFVQVWDAVEASRRINNLNRRVLKDLFDRAIVVTERHKNGAIHFHIIGIIRGRPDIRSGFNHAAVKGRNYSSVSDELRGLWAHLREVLPNYGFGRAELTPIEKTGEAIACYVSKYIEKNICNRLKEDHRKKLVRYIGFEKSQLKPNEFSWGTKRATAWRLKTRQSCALVEVHTQEQAAEAFGPRWAFHVSRIWQAADENLFPGLACSFEQKQVIGMELAKLAGAVKFKRLQKRARYSFDICGESYDPHEFADYSDKIEQGYRLNFPSISARNCLKKPASPVFPKHHSGKVAKIRNFGYLRFFRSAPCKN